MLLSVDKGDGYNIKRLKELAASLRQEHQQVLKKIKKLPSDKIDNMFNDAHHKAFENIDCLQCANCCKSISPIITDRDIDRMSKALGLKPSVVAEKFLRIDSDGDYVFTQSPCPFLLPDNYCQIYEQRPKACREYPHTDRRKMKQILSITKKNIAYCPAVFNVMEQIRAQLKG